MKLALQRKANKKLESLVPAMNELEKEREKLGEEVRRLNRSIRTLKRDLRAKTDAWQVLLDSHSEARRAAMPTQKAYVLPLPPAFALY